MVFWGYNPDEVWQGRSRKISAFMFIRTRLFQTILASITETIQRAQLTTNIKDREPVDDISSYVTGSEVIFYTELVTLPDKFITHEWYYEGKLQTSVNLEVDALSGIWRTWSSKRFQHTNTGNWFVLVRGEQGQILYRLDFIFRGL